LFLQRALVLGLTAVACLVGVVASAQNIYSCVDAKGRTITADRPIVECLDRTQHELTGSGTVKRQLGPSLTAQEWAMQDAKDKLAAEQRARKVDQKRLDRALLLRYPSRPVHQQERAEARAQIDEVIKAARKRTADLAEQRKGIQNELEFYVKDPRKAPEPLKNRLLENNSALAAQVKYIGEQEQEKNRLSLRFDQELAKLQELWMPVVGEDKPAAGYQSTSKKVR
jgi:hypothetical protein